MFRVVLGYPLSGMPQDSTHIIELEADTIYVIDRSGDPYYRRSEEPDYGFGFIVLASFFIFFSLPIILRFLARQIRRLMRHSFITRQKVKAIKRVYEDREVEYRNWLFHYNPYYRRLSEELKDRFLTRTLLFRAGKNFHFHEIDEQERIPLLISAAAVQLTFGLEQYQMDYFKDIHILRENYHYGLYNVPFEGHVSDDGIFFSWSNFERAFADYSDGQNVGLHEMAHALAYVNFVVKDGKDPAFAERFVTFSKTGRRIFNEMQTVPNMLGAYAATNYNEFWAVCVENFFERPFELKTHIPELYTQLTLLLNQDPMHPGLFLHVIENEPDLSVG